MVFTMILFTIASATILSCSASQRPQERSAQSTFNRYEYASLHMGSRCTIVLYAPSERAAANAARSAFDKIHEIELVLSDYNPQSESMQATAQPHGQWVSASPVFLDVMERSQQFYKLSNGAFDPTVGVYTYLWRRAKQSNSIPTHSQLKNAQRSAGFDHIDIDLPNQRIRFNRPQMILDFGAIGKGYAADRALDVLRDHGFHIALIDLGGDLAFGQSPPDHPNGWSVTIQTGISTDWQTSIHSSGLATSGDLERHYESNGVRYSHIIDPRTGMGITDARAVSVKAHDATTADALASIVSILGDEMTKQLESQFPGVQIWVVQADTLNNANNETHSFSWPIEHVCEQDSRIEPCSQNQAAFSLSS